MTPVKGPNKRAKTCTVTKTQKIQGELLTYECVWDEHPGAKHFDGHNNWWEPNKRAKKQGSAPYPLKDGRWAVTFKLPGEAGERRRKTVSAKTAAEADAKATLLKRELLISGDLSTATQTLGTWINIYFREIGLKKLKPRTAATYRSYIDNHIIPSIGKVRLDQLTPAHVRKLHNDMLAAGLSSTSVGQAHRILAVALKYAQREHKWLTRNVANLVDVPRKAATELVALDAAEAIKVLDTATSDPLASLWWAVLLTGARQGELLGLAEDRVTDSLDFSWQLQRLSWEHGCGTKADDKTWPCGRKRGTDCPKKKITHPADWEHKHLQGGLYLSRPKSDSSRREIPLVEPLKSALELQIKSNAGKKNPHGLVWTNPDGSPIDPRAVSKGWDLLLKRAGVPDVRFHDGRHSAVDLLFEVGVEASDVQEIVGHSNLAMTHKYRSKKAKAIASRPRLAKALEKLSAMLTENDTPKQ